MKVKNMRIKKEGRRGRVKVVRGKVRFREKGWVVMGEGREEGKGNISFREENGEGRVEVGKEIYVEK